MTSQSKGLRGSCGVWLKGLCVGFNESERSPKRRVGFFIVHASKGGEYYTPNAEPGLVYDLGGQQLKKMRHTKHLVWAGKPIYTHKDKTNSYTNE